VSTDGAIGLVEPYLVEYYGTGSAKSVDEPLGTATTKPRFGLVRPTVVINGEKYLLDIRFRMLQPHELAAAQGFRRNYKFTGNKSDQVKQIGNAVPRNLARAVSLAVLRQDPNVADLMEQAPAA
jgi:DNA (cytosine-5)-methyltransferase 1